MKAYLFLLLIPVLCTSCRSPKPELAQKVSAQMTKFQYNAPESLDPALAENDSVDHRLDPRLEGKQQATEQAIEDAIEEERIRARSKIGKLEAKLSENAKELERLKEEAETELDATTPFSVSLGQKVAMAGEKMVLNGGPFRGDVRVFLNDEILALESIKEDRVTFILPDSRDWDSASLRVEVPEQGPVELEAPDVFKVLFDSYRPSRIKKTYEGLVKVVGTDAKLAITWRVVREKDGQVMVAKRTTQTPGGKYNFKSISFELPLFHSAFRIELVAYKVL